ncbi:aldo/keto reductase [Curtobacterium flaccumfaciens]|uniref:aldo/keto reductase n=1 Tax=Curtobacterium flaccumfaciens TaxID=2035 RepID=UPI000FFEC71E|nr:aldo/keto reductase [Curtobacterium flaccumfaciens]MCS0644845.1 aldo/keto reductase [Curtobacterium flaccumfaciens pv. flaccumfaciens]MCS6526867.1 aldo/keto reductase [Curtobacterium flaccumfaciens pv. flaccumfaciens]MCS6528993.1 aldo/keto reductase [Curtobacterium flaccumfaciens pv. flaccumfaciens]NUU11990.1 aldo/keto reductase [Curtobacterium flaccumfaciens]RXF83369.1 alcohol dehydrogenase [Curtobacterium flaccumfaciens pv. flaccumfaciens]
MTTDTKRLGNSGLEISSVVLGMMSYGDPDRGSHAWSVGIDDARPFVRRAFEAGITTFDTANVYSDGSSEEITGTLLAELAPREDVQVFTKVFNRMRPGRNGAGLSRAAIMHEIDASLTRLGTDYVDLYQIHRFDPATPIEETMEALHDVVKAGKARYIGASSMWAWQFAEMQHTAERHGWTKFVSMQDQYNLLEREEEREMLPFCEHTGVGVIPWSPLARGRVTRPWDASDSGSRAQTDEFGKTLYKQDEDANRAIVDAVEAVATERGVPMAQVALAWVAGKPAVSAPIVGATKEHHIDDAVAAASLTLTDDEVTRLESAYTPRVPSGF